MPKLNFPPVRLRARSNGGRVEVWDPLRGAWLVLTPEEWVRRHLISFLAGRCGFPMQRIVQEYPVPLNGQPQRADVVVVDDRGAPAVLAECKAAGVPIDERVLAQAVRYNSVLGARRIILTNGMEHRCYSFDGLRYSPCGFPTM